MGPEGLEFLPCFKKQYNELDTHLLNNNASGIAEVFGNYVTLIDAIDPFYQDDIYKKVLNVNINEFKKMVKLYRSLCTKNGGFGDKVRLLQQMHDFHKPLANHLYNVGATYPPIDKCNGKL